MLLVFKNTYGERDTTRTTARQQQQQQYTFFVFFFFFCSGVKERTGVVDSIQLRQADVDAPRGLRRKAARQAGKQHTARQSTLATAEGAEWILSSSFFAHPLGQDEKSTLVSAHRRHGHQRQFGTIF